MHELMRSFFKLVILFLIGFVLLAGTVTGLYYKWAIAPRGTSKSQVRVVVSEGDSASTIARKLSDKKLIRSAFAFRAYTEIHGYKDKLQAGGYVLSPSQSVAEMVEHLVSGKSDEFNVVILPGQTVREIKASLIADGFYENDVDAAFAAAYDHPVLAGRPTGQGLEGYVYPDTYRVSVDATAKDVLLKSFDELQRVLQENDLQQLLAARGFNVHQALTLASIVQKEVSNSKDQHQVAQVFESRLSQGMILGSDVTFIYAAKQLGIEPMVDLDSPYNTRRYPGLPPGPISNFNLSALDAVANPAEGDYLYFVAGDDGTTYYARTLEEHENNVKTYCKELCS